MWPSATSFNWNSFDVGPHRDVFGEIANATRARGLRLGAYHSLFEWYNPLFLADQAANFSTRAFAAQKTIPELYDLVNKYSPELIWSDGDWVADDIAYWRSPEFLAWLVNDSPVRDTVVFNDRWGGQALCHHGSFYTCADRFLPSSLVGHKWENAFTIDTQSWGYRRDAPLSDYMTTAEVIATVVQTVALGGNALINVGPARDGTIDAIFADRLTGLGAWLGTNGEAIYGTTPWRVQNETAAATWYTAAKAGGAVFAIFTAWPAGGALHLALPVPSAALSAALLGAGAAACAPATAAGAPGVVVTLPAVAPGSALAAASAWVVELRGVA